MGEIIKSPGNNDESDDVIDSPEVTIYERAGGFLFKVVITGGTYAIYKLLEKGWARYVEASNNNTSYKDDGKSGPGKMG